jgi:hypothetical protein
MFLTITYTNTYGKQVSHTIGGVEKPEQSIQELMKRYGFYREDVQSIEIKENGHDK